MAKALAALVLAAAIVAQAPQPPTFRARADLVQVDVVVVDKDGNPVRRLTAADFALRDRGKPQAIVNFDEVSHARPATGTGAAVPPPIVAQDVSSNQTVQAGRLVVMVVDDLHIYKERTARAREIATRVLDDLGHQSSMAVLFTSGKHSTQVVQDRARLAAAVGTLKGRQSWRRPNPAIDKQRGDRIDPERRTRPPIKSTKRSTCSQAATSSASRRRARSSARAAASISVWTCRTSVRRRWYSAG